MGVFLQWPGVPCKVRQAASDFSPAQTDSLTVSAWMQIHTEMMAWVTDVYNRFCFFFNPNLVLKACYKWQLICSMLEYMQSAWPSSFQNILLLRVLGPELLTTPMHVALPIFFMFGTLVCKCPKKKKTDALQKCYECVISFKKRRELHICEAALIKCPSSLSVIDNCFYIHVSYSYKRALNNLYWSQINCCI